MTQSEEYNEIVIRYAAIEAQITYYKKLKTFQPSYIDNTVLDYVLNDLESLSELSLDRLNNIVNQKEPA